MDSLSLSHVSMFGGGAQVRQQFNTIAGLMEGTARPDYRRCVEISTKVCSICSTLRCYEQINHGPLQLEAVLGNNARQSHCCILRKCLFLCCPQASLEEMIAPGALVILTPVVIGTLFGVRTLSGLLAGALVSGVQMAVSMSNTGGAWDNAKK